MSASRVLRGTSVAPAAALVALLASLASAPARAHLITEGDVALVAIDTEPTRRSFSFLVLTPFEIGESLGFTDRGWRASGGFRPGESEMTWIFPRSTRRGVVLTLTGLDLDRRADQVFAFSGTLRADGTVSDRLVYALNLGGPWQADATSSTTSALPPSLVGFEVALPAATACAYTGPTSGTRRELLRLIGDPRHWTCSDGAPPAPPDSFTVVSARGESCSSDAECLTGFCVDGVCCDSECRRSEAFHCLSCFFGPDDPRNGTCGPAPTTHLCRLSRGLCDPMERCDGVSTECPPDRLEPAGTVCRRSLGACDPAEVCDGSSAACPPDERAAIGTTCRPSRGPCDPEERCEGAPTCPSDAFAPDGALCDDGLACTEFSLCRDGVCVGVAPLECDDGDPCTADACDDEGGCMHVPIERCCLDASACDDGDPCTADTCESMRCVARAIAGCGDAGSSGLDGGLAPDGGGPAQKEDDAARDEDAARAPVDGGADPGDAARGDAGSDPDAGPDPDAGRQPTAAGGGCACRAGGAPAQHTAARLAALALLSLVALSGRAAQRSRRAPRRPRDRAAAATEAHRGR